MKRSTKTTRRNPKAICNGFNVSLKNTKGMRRTKRLQFEYYLSIGLKIRSSIAGLRSFLFIHSLAVDFSSKDKVVVFRSQKDHTPILVIQPAS